MRTRFLQKALETLGDIGTNSSNLALLEECKQQLVPFIGAGLSVDFGYPMWGQFLQETANDFGLGAQVVDLLARNKYEEVAEVLTANGPRRFNDALRLRFNDRGLPQRLGKCTVHHVPRIARGPVLTTNFDRVVERAFEEEASRKIDVFYGSHIERASYAVQTSKRVLLKLHGDHADSASRVLTLSEYAREYGSTDPDRVDFERPLPSVLAQALGARPLLFLGCSLNSDRTTLVMARIAKRLPGLVHFALLASSENTPDRIKQLDSWGIRPLFFPVGQFPKIEQFLALLADAIGSDESKRCSHSDLAEIRRQIVSAPPARELRRSLYELDKIPKEDIHYSEAKDLEHDIKKALRLEESFVHRTLMVFERRSLQYSALSVLLIAAVATLVWRGALTEGKPAKSQPDVVFGPRIGGKPADDTASIGFARGPDLQLALLSTATALDLQITNVGEETARDIRVTGVAWQIHAPTQAFHKVYSVQEVHSQSAASLYNGSNSETRSEGIWKIWDKIDRRPISGYFTITCQNCLNYRAWAFNGSAPGQFVSWPLVEFKYPEDTPRIGQCVDYPSGSCGPSDQIWTSGHSGKQPGASPAKSQPDVVFKPLN